MKKLLLCSLLFSIVFSTYAKSYEELIKDGEDFENKKQWIYALGAYYDAIQVSENYEDKDPEEAKQKYNKLNDCIREGNPGFGEFNIFSMHDEWVNLIKNAEQYFTKTFPYKITYENLEMDSADYESKTANYKLALKVEESDLYKNVLEILKTGYSNTDHKDWTDLESDNKTLWFNNSGIWTFNTSWWDGTLSSRVNIHRKSVFNTKHEKIEKVTEYPTLQKEAQSIYQKNGVALSYLASMIIPYARSYSYLEGISVCEVPAFAACFSESISTWNGHDENFRFMLPFYVWGKQTCYDLKLGIYDENDSLIIEGKRQTVCTGDFSYLFTKIPQEKLSVLDSKKYKIKLLGIWLNYGVYDISLMTDDDIKNKTIRGIVKPLPDIKIQTDNVVFFDVIEQQRLERERIAKEEERKRKIYEEERAELERQLTIRKERKAERDRINAIIQEKKNSYVIPAPYKVEDFFESIGLIFSENNNFEVEEIIRNTPASKAKVRQGYILVAINGDEISKLKMTADKNDRINTQLIELSNKLYSLSDDDFDINKASLEASVNEFVFDDCYLVYSRDYIISVPLSTGTTLQFQDPTGKKTAEVIVP